MKHSPKHPKTKPHHRKRDSNRRHTPYANTLRALGYDTPTFETVVVVVMFIVVMLLWLMQPVWL